MNDYQGKNNISSVIAVLILVFLSGCAAQPVNVAEELAPCDKIDSKNLSVAFDEATSNLSRPECREYFDKNFTILRQIAKGDPKIENRALFASWLNWANKSGVTSVKKSRSYFNRYFNTTFVSLPTHGNLCAHLSRDEFNSRLQSELVQKSEGYNEILGDAEGYSQVYTQYNDLTLMLESLSLACG